MSFKFSSFSSFFPRVSHKVEHDKKNSASQFVTLTSKNTKKTDLTDSSSKIARFFHRLLHSKEKAREGVEAAIQKKDAPHPVSLDVQSQSNERASLSAYVISFNTAAQTYLEKLDEITIVPADPADSKTTLDQRHSDTSNPELNKTNGKDGRNVSDTSEARYVELDQRRSFIESNEGRFMIDITNMGSYVDNPQVYCRPSPQLDLPKTLAHAFQIYYEEGKLVHEDSFATPGWGYDATAQSPKDLESLKANLKKISPWQNDGQELLQKAVGAIEGRIKRLSEEGETGRNPF